MAQWPAPTRLWIAFSGGCDSHVLLHACASLRDAMGLRLGAIHIDHGLHPRSADWARHCRARCAELGVDYEERRAELSRAPGDSLEAVARAERYRLLAQCLKPGEQVATAQHQDDQAETLLLALLRGSGVHGLAAMAPQAPLGAGMLIRPLLEVGQRELCSYAERHRLDWLEDPSNSDLALDRNRLRQQVMPLLRERWPAAAVTIARSAEQAAEAAALIDDLADQLLPQVQGSRPGSLSIARLTGLETIKAKALIRRWLRREGFRPPSAARLQTVFSSLLSARADAMPVVAWSGCELRRYRDDLFALASLPPFPATEPSWDGQQPLQLAAGLGRLSLEPDDSPRALSRQEGPSMSLRFRAAGLRCRPGYRPSRALKQLFQAAGIPSWLRPYVPLLLDARGELLAVAGVARCSPATELDGLWICWQAHPWSRYGWFAERV